MYVCFSCISGCLCGYKCCMVLFFSPFSFGKCNFTTKEQVGSIKSVTCSLSSELHEHTGTNGTLLDGRLVNHCAVFSFGIIPILQFKGVNLLFFFSVFKVSDYALIYIVILFFRSLLSLRLSLKLGKNHHLADSIVLSCKCCAHCLCVP